MTDPHNDLAAGPWRFVERFAAAYARPLTDGDGHDLREVEERLGRPLPAALHTLYGLVGARDDLTRVQDPLLRPAELRVDDGVLVYRVECQAAAEWGVALPAGDDPPVLYRPLWGPREENTWRPFLPAVSWAAVDLVLSEWVMGTPYSANIELDGATLAALERHYRRLAVPDHPQWAEPDGPPMRWFTGPDAILWDNGAEFLWVRGRTEDALLAVQETLPGPWIGND